MYRYSGVITSYSIHYTKLYDAGATVNTSGSAPVAGFNADEVHGCDNLTVSFTDLSNNNPTSWAWDFGDGNTSNGQNPVHTYLTAGEYSVSLVAANEYGNDTYSVTDFVTVGETPVLSMSMTEESISGNDGTASVSANGGLMPYIFVWNNAGASETISGLTAGEYCVTVVITSYSIHYTKLYELQFLPTGD